MGYLCPQRNTGVYGQGGSELDAFRAYAVISRVNVCI
jgi:hypothetical protein